MSKIATMNVSTEKFKALKDVGEICLNRGRTGKAGLAVAHDVA